MKRCRILLVFIVAITVVAIGCAKEEEKFSKEHWLQKGKDCLANVDYACAYDAFKKVLNHDPDNEQAKYGIILANDQNLSYGLGGILAIFSSEPYEPTAKECRELCENLDECGWLETWGLDEGNCVNMCDPNNAGAFGYDEDMFKCIASAQDCTKVEECLSPILEPTQENCIDACAKLDTCKFMNPDTYGIEDCVDRCPHLYTRQETQCFVTEPDCKKAINCFLHYGPLVQTLFDSFYADIADEATKHANAIAKLDDFAFYIDYLAFSPSDLIGLPDLLASGRHDVAAAHFYSSFAYLYLAVFKIALSLNIDVNINTIETLPPAPTNLLDIQGIINYLAAIRDMLTDILYDPARSGFGYLTEDGAELLPSASHDIAGSARAVRLFIEELKSKEYSSLYAFPLEDTNGDGKWSAGESIYLRGWGMLDYDFADDIKELAAALEACFDDGEPFDLSTLKPILKNYGYGYINLLIDLLDILGYGEIDLSKPLLDPNPDGIRDYADQTVFIIDLLIQLLEGIA